MKRDQKPYSILVVEDNPGDAAIVQELLDERFADARVTNTTNFYASKALLQMPGQKFDVILLDLSLPDKDGNELIKAMSQIAGTYPIIILTGYDSYDFSVQSISMGIADYLVKDSLNAEMLYRSIVYAVERKKVSLQLEASEKRYSDLFHLSPEPMCVYDSANFELLKINRAATEHFGYGIEDCMRLKIIDILPEEDLNAFAANIKAQKRQINETYKGNYRIFKKSGELIELETFSTPIILHDRECTVVLAIDVTEKKRYENKITKAIIKTQDDERYEIGGELHDNVCQILATSQMCLGMLKDSLEPSRMHWFDQCSGYITMALNEIRNLSHRLAPAFFNESTLQEAFRILLSEFNVDKKYEIQLQFDTAMMQFPINLDLQLNLYRILQEQLKNIQKYSDATAISVSVQVLESNKIVMIISDNGRGFEPGASKTGIGLANMKRRTEIFAGKFQVLSAPGKGCTIMAEIPFKDSKIAACN